jgi:hypothetical protein
MRSLFYAAYYPCDRIRDMLYDALEGTLGPIVSFRFKMHIRGCAKCKEYMRLYRLAADMSAFRRDNPPPTELMDKTLAFLEQAGIAAPESPEDQDSGPGSAGSGKRPKA